MSSPHSKAGNSSPVSKGFTLIELTIATAVVSVLIAVIMTFLSNQLVANAMANARSQLLLEAQLSLDSINSDIKHAAGVDDINRWEDDYSPGAPGDLLSWEPDEDTLVLAAPANDKDNDFLYEDPFAYITHKDNLIYFVEDGTLWRRTLAAEVADNAASTTCPEGTTGCPADTRLINNVTDFEVRYFNADDDEVEPDSARSVRVDLTITDDVYGREISVDHSIRSVFRND